MRLRPANESVGWLNSVGPLPRSPQFFRKHYHAKLGPVVNERTLQGWTTMKLGDRLKDRITQFTGVATGRVEYITGCTQFLLAPPVKGAGELVPSVWFDDARLEVIEKDAIDFTSSLAETPAPGFGDEAPIK